MVLYRKTRTVYRYRKRRAAQRIRGRRILRRRRRAPVTRRYVRRAIRNAQEIKERVGYFANQTVWTADQATQQGPFALSLLPNIPEGTEDGERIGNEVTPRGGIVKGFINLKPHNAETNAIWPVYVKMWVLSYKKSMQTQDYSRYFEVGQDRIGFQANMLDMTLPINSDDWTLYSTRLFKFGTTTSSQTYYSNGGAYASGQAFSRPFVVNYGKYVRQKLRYDDVETVGGGFPTNRNLLLVFQVVKADGSSSAGMEAVELHYTNTFKYSDA